MDLLEAVRLEQVDRVPVVPVAARRLRAGLLEADLAVLLELVLEEVPAERPAVLQALEAGDARTRSSIPPMARFPTRRRLAKSPTT